MNASPGPIRYEDRRRPSVAVLNVPVFPPQRTGDMTGVADEIGVDLLLTQMPDVGAGARIDVDTMRAYGDRTAVHEAAWAFALPQPDVVLYNCFGASAISKISEAAIRGSLQMGAQLRRSATVTTAGAFASWLSVEPDYGYVSSYSHQMTYNTVIPWLTHAGGRFVGAQHIMGLTERIADVSQDYVDECISDVAAQGAKTILVFGNTLVRPDVTRLESELGVTIVTANDVGLWAAVRALQAAGKAGWVPMASRIWEHQRA